MKRLCLDCLLIVLGIVFIVLGCWIHWEAVVKPLKSMARAWDRDFPAPFYFFYAPIWLWHDLAYLLIILGGIILGYYAVRGLRCKS